MSTQNAENNQLGKKTIYVIDTPIPESLITFYSNIHVRLEFYDDLDLDFRIIGDGSHIIYTCRFYLWAILANLITINKR